MARNTRKGRRAIKTEYYASPAAAKDGEWTSLGHSLSERGAIRGSVVRVFMEEHAMARIYDAEGILIYTIKPSQEGMRITYGAS